IPASAQQAANPAVSASAQLTLDELRTFTDVFNQVRQNYVEPVDDAALLNAAITGMLAELDPHSSYLPNREFLDLENSAKGQYVGIGIDVAPDKGRILVKQVISPSPADSAGINPGDFITYVNQKSVKGRPVQEAIDELNGPPGSAIELVILKPDAGSSTLTLKREFVKVPALNFRLLENRYGYFQIVYFHRDTATDLKQALDSVLADDVRLDGLILDLRDNPGGVLQPAIDTADGFLDQGTIVTMRGRNTSMQLEYSAKPGQWLPSIPLVLLVDRGTASASEVLAGALQDHRRAVLIGQRTFGKGSVQSVLALRNGAGIKLTTARYYTPSGKSIQAEGILPDLVVAEAMQPVTISDERIREVDLDRHLDNEAENTSEVKPEDVRMEEDYPLYEALQVLRLGHILTSSDEPE
ncbi:MAG: S41 family peptidase, partial [Lysobacterales bacterium]